MTKLFVGGFPLDIDEQGLAELLSLYGEIATIKIVRDKKTGKCKGYAFVEVVTLDDAGKIAAALNGSRMKDRELTIKLAEEKKSQPVSFRPFQPANTNVARTINGAPHARPKRPRLAK